MEIISRLSDVYELKSLIAIYQDERHNGQYIEFGHIRNDGNVIWKPMVLSDFYQNIRDQILERLKNSKPKKDVIFLPMNVLYFTQEYNEIIFYTAPTRRLVYFKFWKKPIDIPLPGLLFRAKGRSIKVNAYKRKGVPDNKTIFYSCPLPNGTCMGNVSTEIDYSLDPKDVMKRVLHLYFDSTFTEENIFNMVHVDFDEIPIKKFYRDLSKKERFPNELLTNPQKLFS